MQLGELIFLEDTVAPIIRGNLARVLPPFESILNPFGVLGGEHAGRDEGGPLFTETTNALIPQMSNDEFRRQQEVVRYMGVQR